MNTEVKDNSKSIYVIFLQTPFKIGKLIRFVTNYKYNHTSISFSENADVLYSFARYNKNSPFVGGFLEESPLRYIKDTDKRTCVKVFKINLEDKYYNCVKSYIEDIKNNKSEYMYNLFSAMLYPLHKQVKIKNAYICIEFVINVLKIANVLPEDYKSKYSFSLLAKDLNEYKIYEGDINSILSNNIYEGDVFFEKINRKKVFTDTIKSLCTLSHRLFCK